MEPNEIIHQSVRLKIMSALNAVVDGEAIDFVTLKAISGATDGNLGAHLVTLENAGYVKIEKDFVGKKPRTRAAITKEGRKAFARHVAYLRDVLDNANMANGAES
jgi:DNA-binding transcriptional ArsR family regulator